MLNLDKDFEKYFPSFDFQLKEFQKDVINNLVEKEHNLLDVCYGGWRNNTGCFPIDCIDC